MTEKKGFFEKIFGKTDSCCGGPKIVPKAGVKKTGDEKNESCGCSCCGPKIVPKTDADTKKYVEKESQK